MPAHESMLVLWYPQPDLESFMKPEIRAAVAERNIKVIFNQLQRYGYSQRQIAALVAMSQSEVSEILGDRRVGNYDVLVRIAEGLGIPRGWMGLSYEPDVNVETFLGGRSQFND